MNQKFISWNRSIKTFTINKVIEKKEKKKCESDYHSG